MNAHRFETEPTGPGNGSMFAGKFGVGDDAIGPGTGADRSRGEVAEGLDCSGGL